MKRFMLAGAAMLGSVVATGAQAQVVDGGFEQQASSVGAGGYCYFTIPNGNGPCSSGAWSGTGGFQGENNTAFPGTQTPDGSFYGFVQGQSTLTQMVTLAAGSYVVNWLDAGRNNTSFPGNQSYTVSVGANTFGGFATTTGQPFTARQTGSFSVAAGTYALTFAGLSATDNTAFIDAVSIAAAVPEPATWGMMILGFGAMGVAMRRRRAAGRLAIA